MKISKRQLHTILVSRTSDFLEELIRDSKELISLFREHKKQLNHYLDRIDKL